MAKVNFVKIFATGVQFSNDLAVITYGDSKATVDRDCIASVTPSVTYPGCVSVCIEETHAPKWF